MGGGVGVGQIIGLKVTECTWLTFRAILPFLSASFPFFTPTDKPRLAFHNSHVYRCWMSICISLEIKTDEFCSEGLVHTDRSRLTSFVLKACWVLCSEGLVHTNRLRLTSFVLMDWYTLSDQDWRVLFWRTGAHWQIKTDELCSEGLVHINRSRLTSFVVKAWYTLTDQDWRALFWRAGTHWQIKTTSFVLKDWYTQIDRPTSFVLKDWYTLTYQDTSTTLSCTTKKESKRHWLLHSTARDTYCCTIQQETQSVTQYTKRHRLLHSTPRDTDCCTIHQETQTVTQYTKR